MPPSSDSTSTPSWPARTIGLAFPIRRSRYTSAFSPPPQSIASNSMPSSSPARCSGWPSYMSAAAPAPTPPGTISGLPSCGRRPIRGSSPGSHSRGGARRRLDRSEDQRERAGHEERATPNEIEIDPHRSQEPQSELVVHDHRDEPGDEQVACGVENSGPEARIHDPRYRND